MSTEFIGIEVVRVQNHMKGWREKNLNTIDEYLKVGS
jgi:hypothetical protein